MSADVDGFLLDRVFQPAADRLASSITCFGLARIALLCAAALQTVVLAGDLTRFDDPVLRALAGGITLLAFFGADRGRVLIAQVERSARPGAMNVRRITLRWQRMSWLAIGMFAAATAVPEPDAPAVGILFASLAWVAAIYFVSCSPAPPAHRIARRTAALPTLA